MRKGDTSGAWTAADLTARLLALVLERSARTVIELETAVGVRTSLDALERHGNLEELLDSLRGRRG